MEIQRRSNLSLKEFENEFVAKSQPVILTDATAHWPARTKWNLDYFESRFDNKEVRFDSKPWKVGDLVRTLRTSDGTGNTPYLKMVKLDEQFEELWDDIGQHTLARNNRLGSKLLPPKMRIDKGIVAVFIGSKGSGFKVLHWDYTYLNVFISQIFGDKDAIIFAPKDSPYLYPRASFDSNNSRITDPFNVDLEKFPDFKHATPIHITIKQGETLFLPGGWWHATNMNHPSIAIAESTLDRFNWNLRRDWYLRNQIEADVPKLRRDLLSFYMGVVDKILRFSEIKNYNENTVKLFSHKPQHTPAHS
ncbi:MAG: Transcription factor jumonji [Verrucomicrobiaceae bacterium]|nr:Transcription factor jumonji [Verrucomicrobiaceae bacterium]